MKNVAILIILFLFPVVVSAQSIEDSGIDEFTGKTIIRTSWTSLGSKAIFPSKNSLNLNFMLRYENEKVFLHLKWYRSLNYISKDSELLFKMKDGSIITLRATDNFWANVDVYTLLDKNYSNNIIQVVYEGDLTALADSNLIDKIRINTIYGSKTLKLDEKNALKISKAYNLIVDYLEKN